VAFHDLPAKRNKVESKRNYPVKAMNASYLVGFLTGTKGVYGKRI
jgi:hypothetical protein